MRFVAQEELPVGESYEAFIARRSCCPTRPSWHDAFNGLCWSRFGRSKAVLNRLQAGEIARDGIGAVRGRLRDRITVLDENAALLQAPDALWDALAAHRWRQAFVDLRGCWPQARLLVFGHALLDKLRAPRKALTAHLIRVDRLAGPDHDTWDPWLAERLPELLRSTAPFAHLPLMGVPGWCCENTRAAFYDDARVFRPPRQTDGLPKPQMP